MKLGLAAIKRKTPQELSGRRKRVLDKPFTPEPESVEPQVRRISFSKVVQHILPKSIKKNSIFVKGEDSRMLLTEIPLDFS